MLQGLAYLHGQGVVHRDIKGANILSDKHGNLKLADFGLAANLKDSPREDERDTVGTPYWMAPEIITMQDDLSTACDVWSLGCTVIELLTGKPPYSHLMAYPAMIKVV